MNTEYPSIPQKRILIFGASGHIGGPLANHVHINNPLVELRLVTSNPDRIEELEDRFPFAQCMHCDYRDCESLDVALEGVDGVFMITPDLIDEQVACTNLVNTIKKKQISPHVVRIMGDPPGVKIDDVPESLRSHGNGVGAAISHQIARNILSESGIEVTFLNVAGYYMDDLSGLWHGRGIREANILVEIKRHYMPYVDPSEVGEAAAIILTRDLASDVGVTYHLNNGHDIVDFYSVAKILSKEIGRKITYREGEKDWLRYTGNDLESTFGKGAKDYFLHYFRWESVMIEKVLFRSLGFLLGGIAISLLRYSPRFALNPVVHITTKMMSFGTDNSLKKILGRNPMRLREWVQLNRNKFDQC